MTTTVLRRVIHPTPYVTIANDVAQDARLSYGARGLLLAMVSLPDDWAFSAERLAKCSPGEGRDWVRARLRELEAAGYVSRTRERGEGGRFRTVVRVSDQPVAEWMGSLAAAS